MAASPGSALFDRVGNGTVAGVFHQLHDVLNGPSLAATEVELSIGVQKEGSRGRSYAFPRDPWR